MSPRDGGFPAEAPARPPDSVHPARAVPYAELREGLEAALDDGLVSVVREGGLSLWRHTDRCVHYRKWRRPGTRAATGLVLDDAAGRVAATPFAKFFRFDPGDHRTAPLRGRPFMVQEKLDGCTVSVWWRRGRWRASGTESFHSPATVRTLRFLDAADLSALVPGTTYLFEAVGPDNGFVVRYERPVLAMLGAVRADGTEMEPDDVRTLAARLGTVTPREFGHAAIDGVLADAAALPATSEGYVVRFDCGVRCKITGAGYRRTRDLVRRVTPRDIWDAMRRGEDLDAMRRRLPDGVRREFDAIRAAYEVRIRALADRTADACADVADMTDRELGLALDAQPEEVRRYLFDWRNSGCRLAGKARLRFLRAVRPDGDTLPGFEPGPALRRMMRPEA